MPKTADPIRPNPAVLVWARETSELSVEDAAQNAGIDSARLLAMERGGAEPGLSELRELARIYRRPLTVLLLPAPPTEHPFPTDFRTVGGRHPRASREVAVALRRARRLQSIITALIEEESHLFTRARLEEANVGTSPEQVAGVARSSLGVSVEEQLRWPNANAAFNHWRARLQAAGILVLVEPMPRDDCRGFALWEPESVPTIVVSRQEAPVAKSFTALHEYGHLLLRTASACVEAEDESPRGRIERWCNRFAAHVLAPRPVIEQAAGAVSLKLRELTDLDSLAAVARRAKVSRHVLAIRLEEIGVAPRGFYEQVRAALGDDGRKEPLPPDEELRIPSERTRLAEIGYGPALAVLQAWRSGDLDTLEAADFLNLGAARLEALDRAAQTMRANYE